MLQWRIQAGFQKTTELNKVIVRISNLPKGGFHGNYGNLSGTAIAEETYRYGTNYYSLKNCMAFFIQELYILFLVMYS